MNLRERRRRQEEGSGAPPGRRGAGRRCSRALAASEAIGSAQSPHAGLQQQPPRIGARAGIHRGARERVRAARAAREPTDSGLGSPPSLMVTPPLFLRCKCCLWGSRQPQSRMLGPKERARRARSQLERPPRPPPSALRPPRHTAAFRALAPLPSQPSLFAYTPLVANQGASLSKRLAFA